ncbi:GNAT family N-acetyltransferase [Nonomuraea sp. NPDC047897]|uniref:GNAT family N-acetyltransferase n=1 Tax=Nonomuraea sp. NPDC047897 TaxID=3364346 RepID=UPI0037170B4E
MLRELRTPDEVRAACGDDDLPVWGAQALRDGARAWALGDAVVTAARDISRRDRLAVWGGTSCAVELVRHALGEVGPSFRPFGEVALLAEVTAKIDGLEVSGGFSWMSLPAGGPAGGSQDGPAGGSQDGPVDTVMGGREAGSATDGMEDTVGWLGPRADEEVRTLLAGHAPTSYAVPGGPGVRRWAGLRLDGRLAAVAADAWSAPSVGFLAGVATAAPLRGRGLAERVCRWVSHELVADHGRAALMVDDDNPAAVKVYERLGYRRRRVLAAHVAGAAR